MLLLFLDSVGLVVFLVELHKHIITLSGIEPVALPPEKEETRYHQEVQEEKIAKYVYVYIFHRFMRNVIRFDYCDPPSYF